MRIYYLVTGTVWFTLRHLAGMAVAPYLRRTGYRFSKDYRHGITLFHRITYTLVDCVAANYRADGYRFRWDRRVHCFHLDV